MVYIPQTCPLQFSAVSSFLSPAWYYSRLLMHLSFKRTARDKLPAYRFQNTASYSMKEQNEQRMTDIEDIDSPGMGIRVRTTAPVCYGRNMTFPRPTSSYAHRHELPAIVTEGESCRLLAEVRDECALHMVYVCIIIREAQHTGVARRATLISHVRRLLDEISHSILATFLIKFPLFSPCVLLFSKITLSNGNHLI